MQPWLKELKLWRFETSTPVAKQGVKLYKSMAVGTDPRTTGDTIPIEVVCSEQGFDRIVEAILSYCAAFLQAEPEVQAELGLYRAVREPKGSFVEFSSRIQTKIREMEAAVGATLPPKIKGFIIKRQARMTPDQLKTIHFWNPTHVMEADKLVASITRLDQPDALVELVLSERANVEGRTGGGRHYTQSSEAGADGEQAGAYQQINVASFIHSKTCSDQESDGELELDPEDVDHGGLPLAESSTGETLVPDPGRTEVEEDVSVFLSAGAEGYHDVQKNLRDHTTGRGFFQSSGAKQVMKKHFTMKKPAQDLRTSTPFRDKAGGRPDRITGRDLLKKDHVFQVQQAGSDRETLHGVSRATQTSP